MGGGQGAGTGAPQAHAHYTHHVWKADVTVHEAGSMQRLCRQAAVVCKVAQLLQQQRKVQAVSQHRLHWDVNMQSMALLPLEE